MDHRCHLWKLLRAIVHGGSAAKIRQLQHNTTGGKGQYNPASLVPAMFNHDHLQCVTRDDAPLESSCVVLSGSRRLSPVIIVPFTIRLFLELRVDCWVPAGFHVCIAHTCVTSEDGSASGSNINCKATAEDLPAEVEVEVDDAGLTLCTGNAGCPAS